MNAFIERHGQKVIGRLDGFDRVRLCGTLRMVANDDGLSIFLHKMGVKMKDFRDYAQGVTKRLKEASKEVMESVGRSVKYLSSPKADKEQVAREIAAADGVTEGPVCALTCVEPCRAFSIRKDDRGLLRPRASLRQCLHIYHYRIHPVFGWMNARLQTWFPFTITICINGREWLSRQMDAEGIRYVRRDNCFAHVADLERAQQLLDAQTRITWPRFLDQIAGTLNPAHDDIFRDFPLHYYWSAQQTEWASDVMFRSPAALASLYPKLTGHAMTVFDSRSVMRFLGGRELTGTFEGEVTTKYRRRVEGVCVKHQVKKNAIKMYDKGSALRIETTINDPSDFKVYRKPERQPKARNSWQRMRKGTADLRRRATVSQAANERYLEALAAADCPESLGRLVHALCQPTTDAAGKRARALNPLGTDAPLLRAIGNGDFLLNGFRNRDLRVALCGEDPDDDIERRRRSAAISRKLRLLRAHGLIKKVPHTTRYHLTKRGRQAVTAIIAAQTTPISRLAA